MIDIIRVFYSQHSSTDINQDVYIYIAVKCHTYMNVYTRYGKYIQLS